MILHTARTVGTGFALFARPLTSCVFYIYIYIICKGILYIPIRSLLLLFEPRNNPEKR